MGNFKFKRKNFTIPEGHFTGQKDMEELPSFLHNAGKGALYGAGIGSVAEGTMGYFKDDMTVSGGAWDGAKKGALAGIVSGVALKFFQNYMHKPMKSIKFQEVDRSIRRQFGTYRVAGLSVGDSIDNRMTMDEKFSFNDREVDKYQINIAIQGDYITMYTFGMSDYELDTCSKILDFYTQKYYGVDYSSKLINKAVNAYSVDITFTNYKVLTNFIMELSQRLNTRINLMNDKAVVSNRLTVASKEREELLHSNEISDREDLSENPNLQGQSAQFPYQSYTQAQEFGNPQRNFSNVPELTDSDLYGILGKTGTYFISEALTRGNYNRGGAGGVLMGLIRGPLSRLTAIEASKYGLRKGSRSEYGNAYLEKRLKDLHFKEGVHYTVDNKNAECNIALIHGRFILTTLKVEENYEKIDSTFYKSLESKISRSDTGSVIVYSYVLDSLSEFDFLLNKLFSTKIKFNIYI